jgi:hypothetical protein
MRGISEVVRQELVWVQPTSVRQTYELRAADDDVVGRLQFDSRSLANGETAWQKWTFRRDGFWTQRVTIRARDSSDAVVVKVAWTGGCTLELSQGRQVRFGAANFWRTRWQWSDVATEAPLVQFKSHPGGLMKFGGQVAIDMPAIAYPELPLLIVLGWFLLVLYARSSGAATAVR